MEIRRSNDFHSLGTPLLISDQVLRSRQLGQVDLARMQKVRGDWLIDLAEVKSSEVGQAGMQRFQRARLMNSLRFISALFGQRARLIELVN